MLSGDKIEKGDEYVERLLEAQLEIVQEAQHASIEGLEKYAYRYRTFTFAFRLSYVLWLGLL